MVNIDGIDSALFDDLRRLRSEERAVTHILERSRGGSASEDVLREHRRNLGHVRQQLQGRLGRAIEARDRSRQTLPALRQRAAALRGELEQLRVRVQRGELQVAQATALATSLQVEYERVEAAFSAHHTQVATVHELFPELGPAPEAGAAATLLPFATVPPAPPASPSPAAAPPRAMPPPVIAPAGLRRGPPSAAVTAAATASAELEEALEPPDELPPPEDGPASADGADLLLDVSRAVYVERSRDRRLHVRVPYAAYLRFRASGETFLARCADVSMGGLFVDCPSTLPVGTALTVVFCADGFPVEAPSQVRYESPGVGMGVKFSHLDDEDREAVTALIRHIQSRG